jgi:hypothetical protein
MAVGVHRAMWGRKGMPVVVVLWDRCSIAPFTALRESCESDVA